MPPPSSRKLPKPLRKPAYFPAENVFTRALPLEVVGQREFEECHFTGFDWGQADLSGWRFSGCLFEHCNLTGANLTNTAFQNVSFTGCKLLGLPFQACRALLFGVHFDQCYLDYASFYGRSLPNTRFVDCSLQEADFTRADLTQAVFQNCQLRRAVFSQTRLVGTDFTTAHEVVLDPAFNNLKHARFSLHSLPGLLTQYELVVV